jgi:hypothetical protein
MPKVHTQVAAKDYPEHGIKKGDTYYKWSFRYGGTHKSLTYPKQSQLTQSDFLQRVYDMNETLEDLNGKSFEEQYGLVQALEDLLCEIEELRDEQEEKLSNMPDSLQYGPIGELLQERYDSLDEFYNEVDSAKMI